MMIAFNQISYANIGPSDHISNLTVCRNKLHSSNLKYPKIITLKVSIHIVGFIPSSKYCPMMALIFYQI